MIKVVFFVTKRPEFQNWDEFRNYWVNSHAPIAAKMPGLCKHTVNPILPDQPRQGIPFDGIAELWWDDVESFKASVASPEGVATFEDAWKFLDEAHSHGVIVQENVIL